jgi:hypothetical protein
MFTDDEIEAELLAMVDEGTLRLFIDDDGDFYFETVEGLT